MYEFFITGTNSEEQLELIGDVLRAKGKIRNPSKMVSWALEKIQDFKYRKTFGMTEKELAEESLDTFIINSIIISEIDTIRSEQERKASKPIKRSR